MHVLLNSSPGCSGPSQRCAEEQKRLVESLGLAHGGLKVERADVLPLHVSKSQASDLQIDSPAS